MPAEYMVFLVNKKSGNSRLEQQVGVPLRIHLDVQQRRPGLPPIP